MSRSVGDLARHQLASGRGRLIREHSRVSQGLVAQVLGVSQPTVSQWESCRRFPGDSHAAQYGALLRLLEALR